MARTPQILPRIQKCDKQAGEAVLKVYPYQNETESVDQVKFLGSAATGAFEDRSDVKVYSVSASDEGGNYLFIATMDANSCSTINVTKIVDNDH